MEHIQQPAPVAIVTRPHPMVVVMSLWGPYPRQVEPGVVIELMQGDDQVPDPGGGDVGPHKDGPNRHREDAVEEEVYRVAVSCGQSYGGFPLVMALRQV